MRSMVRYSVAAIVAFLVAAAGAYAIIAFFIRGFEALALLLPLTGALFIPLCALFVWLARRTLLALQLDRPHEAAKAR